MAPTNLSLYHYAEFPLEHFHAAPDVAHLPYPYINWGGGFYCHRLRVFRFAFLLRRAASSKLSFGRSAQRVNHPPCTLFRTCLCHRSGANKKGQPLTTTGEGGGEEGLTANRRKHLVAILRVEPLHLSTFPTLSHEQPVLGFSISEYVVR